MKPSHILALNLCIALPLVVGGIAGVATEQNLVPWYAGLAKPVFNPPAWLFGPVWTLLYILMGISLFLIWRSSRGRTRDKGILIFAIQLVLNFSWTFIFFQFRLAGWALIELSMVWISILVMILFFFRISKTAALLQIPYLCWVTFASILNGSIWWLNP